MKIVSLLSAHHSYRLEEDVYEEVKKQLRSFVEENRVFSQYPYEDPGY